MLNFLILKIIKHFIVQKILFKIISTAQTYSTFCELRKKAYLKYIDKVIYNY